MYQIQILLKGIKKNWEPTEGTPIKDNINNNG